MQKEQTASETAERLQAQTAELEAKMRKAEENVQGSMLQDKEDCLFGPSITSHHQSTDSTKFDPCDASLASLHNQSMGTPVCSSARCPLEPAGTPELERRVSLTRSRMLQHSKQHCYSIRRMRWHLIRCKIVSVCLPRSLILFLVWRRASSQQ